MIKVGFICEGKTEKKIIASDKFQAFLKSIHIDCVEEVVDAKGNGNLLPKFLPEIVKNLVDLGAEKICILTDLDEDACITLTRERLDKNRNYSLVVAVKTSEAWFLSDSECMAKAVGADSFYFENPDKVNAFETISKILLERTGRGASDKKKLAAMMLNKGFDINSASNHPHCHSAKYFVEKLKGMAATS